MHVVIINGSPRIQKYSNTDKIIRSFAKGLKASGSTYELYCVSNRKEWDVAREAFLTSEQIIIALPLYVECLSSMLLEFLESIPTERKRPAQLSFILHGGLDEGFQYRLGERFLQSLPAQLGCTYGGCLIKGGSFFIRLSRERAIRRLLDSYIPMGRLFIEHGNFNTPEAAKFTGPERYPWLLRIIVGMVIKYVVVKKFERYAQEWGCTCPLNDKPYKMNINSSCAEAVEET